MSGSRADAESLGAESFGMNRQCYFLVVASVCAILTGACGGRVIGEDPAQQPIENARKLEFTMFEWQWWWRSPPDGPGEIRDVAELGYYCRERWDDSTTPKIDFVTEVGLRNSERIQDGAIYHRLHDAWQTGKETIVRLRAERAGRIYDLTLTMEIAKLPRMGTPIRFVKLPLSTAD
jgi:hypothetical protein